MQNLSERALHHTFHNDGKLIDLDAIVAGRDLG